MNTGTNKKFTTCPRVLSNTKIDVFYTNYFSFVSRDIGCRRDREERINVKKASIIVAKISHEHTVWYVFRYSLKPLGLERDIMI